MRKAFSLIELSIVILIIGILIAGVTQGSRLVSESRLKTARTLTESSIVSSVEGLAFWFETSMESSFPLGESVEDGDTISEWYDRNPQSSVKHNALAVTSTAGTYHTSVISGANSSNTSGPEFVTDGINSIPTLRFDNVSANYEFMVVDNKLDVSPQTSMTMFVVVRNNSGGGHVIDRLTQNSSGVSAAPGSSTSSGFPLFSLSIAPSTKNLTAQFRYDATGPLLSLTGTYSASENEPYIFTMERRYNDEFNVYVNGSLEVTGSDDGTSITLDPITIGRHMNDPTQTSEYDISEVIFFDKRVISSDRDAIEDYLSQKYGVAVTH